MQVPAFGIIYIALSLLFCLKREWFIYWFIIGNSLFYTTVIVVAGHTSIKPFHVNTVLMFIFFVRGRLFNLKNYLNTDGFLLLGFLVWIIISYIISFALPGGFMVIINGNSYKGGDALKPFTADISNITQLAFPAFGIFAFFVIKAFIRSKKDLELFTKAFLWSFVPLAISVVILFTFRNITHNSAFLQIFFRFTNVLFDRDVSDNGYNSIGDIARTFTYVGEASYTAKYYLLLMSMFLTMILYKKNTTYKRFVLLNLILFQLLLIVILGSTTGYVGFCILVCIVAVLYFRYKHLFNRSTTASNANFLVMIAMAGFMICVPVCIIYWDSISFFLNYLQTSHLDKLEAVAGSGENRFMSMVIGLDVFFRSPLFGVGYGNDRANSYMIFLLADTGVVGFFLINAFCAYLILVPLRKLKKMDYSMRVMCMTYVTIFISAWIIYFCFASNVAVLFGWFWTIVALLSVFAHVEKIAQDNDEIDLNQAKDYSKKYYQLSKSSL